MALVILGNGLNHVIDFEKLNEDSVIVDLGSAIGDFVMEVRKHPNTENSRVICVECSRRNIEKFKTRDLGRTELVERAIGGTDIGSVTFTEFVGQLKPDGNHKYYQWGNTGSLYEGQLEKDKSVEITKYEVPLISIKGLMNEFEIEEIDYLKMDVEGAEYDTIFALNEETAGKIKQMSLETHDLSKNEALVSHLTKLGFQVEQHDKDEYYAFR